MGRYPALKMSMFRPAVMIPLVSHDQGRPIATRLPLFLANRTAPSARTLSVSNATGTLSLVMDM
jgi:hypothetical protein